MIKKEHFANKEEDILNYSYKNFNTLFPLIDKIKENKKISEKLIEDFLSEVYENKILVNFNWEDWKEGKEIIENENFDYNTLDILGICKLLTGIIQSESFIDGGLKVYFEDGTILKVLEIMEAKLR